MSGSDQQQEETTMRKYIDLIHAIEGSYSMTGCERATVEAVLGWLDSNADQVPGLTITQSQAKNLSEVGRYYPESMLEDKLESLGITVVPDPEPTNTEKLNDLLMEFTHLNAPNGGEVYDHDFGEFLTSRGVKAPGGDE